MASQQERLAITRTCDWDCLFCGQHQPEPDFPSLSELQGRVRSLLGTPSPDKSPTGPPILDLILTGGEPTLHPQLPELVAWLRAEGIAERVTVETHGVGVSSALRARLVEAGANSVRMLWVGHDETAARSLTRTTFSAEERWDALRAWCEAGVEVRLVIPLVAGVVQNLSGVVDELAARAPEVKEVLFQIAQRSRSPKRWQRLIPPPWVAGNALGDVWTRTADLPFSLGWAEFFSLPACSDERDWMVRRWFEEREAAYGHKGVELVRYEGCDRCAMQRYCSGLDPDEYERWGAEGYAPRRTSIKLNWQEKEDRFPLLRKESRLVAFTDAGGGMVRATLRINGRCNHACPFCFIDRAAPDLPREEVMEDLQRLADMGGRFVAFTGGEPTLVKHLPDYVARAKALGITTRELQTNAMAFDDAAFAERIVEAGITTVLVSLHANHAELSDQVTRFEGGWVRTVAGIENLCRTGVEVRVNYVINSLNAHHTADFVRWAYERFVDVPHPIAHLTLSTAQLTVGYGEEWNIPTFDRVVGPLREAIAFCRERGVRVGGMIGECGVPPCVLGLDVIPDEYRRNVIASPFHGDIFTYPEGCESCAARPWCPGVRKTYVALYGADELTPFAVESESAAAPL